MDTYVNVKPDLDDMEITSAETKATYDEIKEYYLKECGAKVGSLYISRVKRKYGLDAW